MTTHVAVSDELTEAALELADAASDVIATWEAGDLAEAVRWLDDALAAFNAAHARDIHGSANRDLVPGATADETS